MKYRRTVGDRFGPALANSTNALRGALLTAAFGAFGGTYGAYERGWNPVVGGVVGAVVAGALAWLVITGLSKGGGALFEMFIMPQGTYEETFSYEDSLLARGHYAEAIAAFERHAAEGTGGATVLIRAADLHARHGDSSRAAELFREAQRRPDLPAESHMYVTNRLIDLYTGPLSNPDATMSELRRLIAVHPSSDAAKHARTALVNLKRQLRSESTD